MEDEMYRDDLSPQEVLLIMDNMRKASRRAQVIAGFWFYLLLGIGLLLLNWWIVGAAFIPAARVIWVGWRDRWVHAQ